MLWTICHQEYGRKICAFCAIHQGTLESRKSYCTEILSPQNFGNSEILFNSILEVCGNLLQNMYSIMADTTSNTGKKSGVNKRLEQFFIQNIGRDIHVLECFFHVNEIYFNHMI